MRRDIDVSLDSILDNDTSSDDEEELDKRLEKLLVSCSIGKSEVSDTVIGHADDLVAAEKTKSSLPVSIPYVLRRIWLKVTIFRGK